ncbi:hypothetical protein ACR2XN_29185, partial [Klebsiella pneumoniae]
GAETFTHHVPAYQILAGQSNQEAERSLGLVYTEHSILKAKEAINALPSPGEKQVENLMLNLHQMKRSLLTQTGEQMIDRGVPIASAATKARS